MAKELGLNIKLKADGSNIKDVLKDVREESNKTTKTLRTIDKALKFDPKNVELLAEKQQVLRKRIAECTSGAEAYRAKMEKLKADGKGTIDNPEFTAAQKEYTILTQLASKYSDQIREIDNRIGTFGKLKDHLDEVEKATQATESRLKELDEALKLDPDNVDTLNEKERQLKKLTEETADKFHTLNEMMKEGRNIDLPDDEMDDLRVKTQKAAAEIKNVNDRVETLDHQRSKVARLGNGFKDLGDKIESAGTKLKGVSDGMTHAGDTMTATVTAPIVGLATATVQKAISIDDAMTGVRKTVDGTAEQYEALKDAAVDYSKTNAVSPEEILAYQALGAQLGFNIDELKELGEVASGLDIATDMDGETAATQMAQFASLTGMAHDKIRNYASAIVALGNTMPTTESKISNMGLAISSYGKNVGMTQDQILGWAAAMSSVGIEAQKGGSAFARVTSQINTAVLSGNEDLAKFAQAAGMSVDEFRKRWGEDASGVLQTLLQNIDKVKDKTSMLNGLGISNTQDVDTMTKLAAATEEVGGEQSLLAKALANSNDGWEKNTALNNEVASKNEALSSQFDILKNKVGAAANEIGEPLASALIDAIDAAQPLFDAIEEGAEAFSSMDKSQQQMIITCAASVAAIGPLLSLAGRFTGIGADIVMMTGNASKGVGGLLEKLGPMSLKVGAIALAVGVAVAAFAAWKKSADDTAAALRPISDIEEEIGDGSKKAGDDIVSSFGEAIDTCNELKDAQQSVIDNKQDFADSLTDIQLKHTQLDTYIDAIERLRDREKLTKSEQLELTNAVKGYNEITGKSVEVIDPLTGKINASKEALQDEAEAWIERAKAQAYANTITDMMQDQIKSEMDIRKSQQKVEDLAKQAAELRSHGNAYDDWKAGMLDIQATGIQRDINKAVDAYNQQQKDIETLEKEYDNLDETGKAVKQTMSALRDELGKSGEFKQAGIDVSDYTYELQKAGIGADALSRLGKSDFDVLAKASHGSMDTLVQDTQNYLTATQTIGEKSSASLSKFHENVGAVMQQLVSAGVSTQTLASLTDEGFSRMVESTNGSVPAMVAQLNGMQSAVEQMSASIVASTGATTDKANELATAFYNAGINSTQLAAISAEDFNKMWAACDGDVSAMVKKVQEYNKAPIGKKKAVIDGDASGAKRAAGDAQQAVSGVDDTEVKIDGDASPLKAVIETIKGWLSALRGGIRIPFFGSSGGGTGGSGSGSGGSGTHADGGYVVPRRSSSVPRHAGGGILTSPALTKSGWVAEAGAEAIVPLENRKYMVPFANAIGDAISERGGGDTYYVFNVDNATINDDAAMRQAAKNFLVEVKRHAGA